MDRRVRPTARRALVAAAWVLATLLAAAVASGAVSRLSRIGGDVTSPLTQAQVEQALAAQPTATSRPPVRDPTPSPAGRSAGAARRVTAPPQRSMSWTAAGGSVGVTCRGDAITLSYATPRDGWAVLPPGQHPRALEITFAAGNATSTVAARCSAGLPQGTVDEHPGSGGGGTPDNGTGGGTGGGSGDGGDE